MYYGLAQIARKQDQSVEESGNYVECLRRNRQLTACYPDTLSITPLSPESIKLTREFERLLPDPHDPLHYFGMATVRWTQTPSEAACLAMKKSIALLTGNEDDAFAASLYARSLICHGDAPAKIANAQKVIAIDQRIGDHENELTAMLDLAGLYSSFGETSPSLELYETYMRKAQEIGHLPAQAIGLASLGDFYERSGELDRAIEKGWESQVIARSIWRPPSRSRCALQDQAVPQTRKVDRGTGICLIAC